MIDINEEIRRHYKPFSLEGINVRCRDPNWYDTTSVADFVNNQGIIEPTPDKLFLRDHSFVGAAFVVFNNVRYEQRHYAPPRNELNRFWGRDLISLRLEQKLGIISDEHKKKLEEMVASYNNAVISDPTGEVGIYSPHPIPDGTKFYRAVIIFRPILGLLTLGHYYLHGPPTTGKQDEKSPYLSLGKLIPVIPELSPS